MILISGKKQVSYLRVESLTKSFTAETTAANAAVSGVSFELPQGEILCLLGPSGCGKTTLLRLIAGLERPDSGSVWLAGQDLAQVPPHTRDFGMMFQDFALFPHKNVFENVAFGLHMQDQDQEAIAVRVSEMLELVDLAGFEARDISQLSGGEQQRVALARSLAPGPRLLMLDEPLGALDRALRERLMLDLRMILKQVGVTAIYVTHDQTEAFAIADQVAVMQAGRIIQLAPPQTIYAQPATPFVARFLGFHNLISGLVQADGQVASPLGLLPLSTAGAHPGAAVTVLIKPDAASLLLANQQPPITDFQCQGLVEASSFRGRYWQLWLRIGEQVLLVEVPSLGALAVGEKVEVGLDAAKLVVWGEGA
jgi:ABC-type Fe3+/spermidine/putrescine transport system ATPase subunit